MGEGEDEAAPQSYRQSTFGRPPNTERSNRHMSSRKVNNGGSLSSTLKRRGDGNAPNEHDFDEARHRYEEI